MNNENESKNDSGYSEKCIVAKTTGEKFRWFSEKQYLENNENIRDVQGKSTAENSRWNFMTPDTTKTFDVVKTTKLF